MKNIFVVTDGNYGAIAFTTLKPALEYIFGDNEKMVNPESYGPDTIYYRKDAILHMQENCQYSGELPHLGSFTLTEVALLNRNNNVKLWSGL